MGPYQRNPKKVTRAIKYPGLGGPFSGSCWRFLGFIAQMVDWRYERAPKSQPKHFCLSVHIRMYVPMGKDCSGGYFEAIHDIRDKVSYIFLIAGGRCLLICKRSRSLRWYFLTYHHTPEARCQQPFATEEIPSFFIL